MAVYFASGCFDRFALNPVTHSSCFMLIYHCCLGRDVANLYLCPAPVEENQIIQVVKTLMERIVI